MQKKLTIKIVTIAFIAIFLMIPLEMISGKIDEKVFGIEQTALREAYDTPVGT